MRRLTIDPGLHHAGASLGNDDAIHLVGLFQPARSIGDWMGARCLDISQQIVRWTASVHGMQPVELTFEWPQHYDARRGKTKGNPNNLTPLAGIGMAVAGELYARGMLLGDPVTPTPSQWIGQLPKKCSVCDQVPGKKVCKACRGSAWRTPRAYLIESCVTAAELAIIPDQNDVIDACGLALWRAGRLRSAMPGIER